MPSNQTLSRLQCYHILTTKLKFFSLWLFPVITYLTIYSTSTCLNQCPICIFNCNDWKIDVMTEPNVVESDQNIKSCLTVWDFLVRVQVFVHIHGKIHHVRVAEEVQLSLKKFLFIVDLPQLKTNVFNLIWVTRSIKQLHKRVKGKWHRV